MKTNSRGKALTVDDCVIKFGRQYPNIEEQLEEQGFVMKKHEDNKKFEQLRRSILHLTFHSFITEKKSIELIERLNQQIKRSIRLE